MQKQKLRLDELKVDSFVTSTPINNATVIGAGTSDQPGCVLCIRNTVDALFFGCTNNCPNPTTTLPDPPTPKFPDTNQCYSGAPCGVLPTGLGAVTCGGGDLQCAASNYTCNNMGTCAGQWCQLQPPA